VIAEVFTWVQRTPNGHVNPDDELRGGNCTQDAHDPFFLPRYCISSVMIRVGKGVRINYGRPDLRVRTSWASTVTIV